MFIKNLRTDFTLYGNFTISITLSVYHIYEFDIKLLYLMETSQTLLSTLLNLIWHGLMD